MLKEKRPYAMIELAALKQHEEINREHYVELFLQIEQNKYVEPIIVDSNTNIILDGHHRYNVLKAMNICKIPAVLVNYDDTSISVKSWRKDVEVTKNEVIKRGLSGNLYPPKTSRHIMADKPNDRIELRWLR